MYIDAHCHLSDPRLSADLDAAMERCRKRGIGAWVLGGLDPEDWARQEALKSRFPTIRTAFGLHPWWVAQADEAKVDAALEALEAALPRADAIGEMGLDALKPNLPLQEKAFEGQLERREDHPMILHIVRAHAKALWLLNAHGPYGVGGLVHAYSSDLATAQKYIEMGFLISVGGGVLSKGYEALKDAIGGIPVESLVVETDAPDGAGDPSKLWEVAEAVGKLQDRPAKAVLETSAENLKGLFSWK